MVVRKARPGTRVAKAKKEVSDPGVRKASIKKRVPEKPKEAEAVSNGRVLNEHGFVSGTDSAIIAQSLLDGGVDRNDVNRLAEENIGKVNGLNNRNGGEKYVPSMVSAILNKMLTTGNYEIVSTWKLVPKEAPSRKKRVVTKS